MTASGLLINPFEMRPEDVRIEDIAHHLANICRFQGATARFYSVAQHSVLVSSYLSDMDGLYGLLHDASEYLLGDVPGPLKQSEIFAAYRSAESRLQRVIYQAFGLTPDESEVLHLVDRRALWTEQRDLMPPPLTAHLIYADEDRNDLAPFTETIHAWSFETSKRRFLERFAELT